MQPTNSSASMDSQIQKPRDSLRIMKSDIVILLDKDSYLSGDHVAGSITVLLTQDVKIKDLLVRFYGHSRVSWDEQRAYTKGSAPSVALRSTESHLDHTIVLLRKDKLPGKFASVASLTNRRLSARPSVCSQLLQNVKSDSEEGVIIPAGEHTFTFEFTLPKGLPGSYEGKWGQVKYGVKAVMERPWRFDVEREKEFTLTSVLDLNAEPEFVRPVAGMGDFRMGFMCIRRGVVNTELRLNRRAFVPGENIPFYVEIDNGSSRKLRDAKVALTQHVIFRAASKTKKCMTTVTSLSRGEIEPTSSVVWDNDCLIVPNIAPTSGKSQRAIQIKYTVTLSIHYSAWEDEFSLPVNIIVGTVGLRKAPINTYMNFLGTGNIPRSPSGRASISLARQSAPIILGVPRDQTVAQRRASSAVLQPHTVLPGQAHRVKRMNSVGSDSTGSNRSSDHLLSAKQAVSKKNRSPVPPAKIQEESSIESTEPEEFVARIKVPSKQRSLESTSSKLSSAVQKDKPVRNSQRIASTDKRQVESSDEGDSVYEDSEYG